MAADWDSDLVLLPDPTGYSLWDARDACVCAPTAQCPDDDFCPLCYGCALAEALRRAARAEGSYVASYADVHAAIMASGKTANGWFALEEAMRRALAAEG